MLPRLRNWRREGRKTLLLASSWPDEDRTAVAVDLAQAAADSGVKVLLVDGDSVGSNLSRNLDVLGPGLMECLLGLPFELVNRAPGLDVLGAGRTFAEVRPGAEARDSFLAVSSAYDLVLLDTPPLTTSSLAHSLAVLCDGVVLVVSKRRYRDYRDDSVAGQFRLQGIDVLGVIVTREDAVNLDLQAPRGLAGLLTALGLRA